MKQILQEKQRVSEANHALWDAVARDFILDDIDEAICVVDSKGIVTVWNKKSETIYDLPKEEIIGKYMDDVLEDTVIMDVLNSGEDKQNIYKSTRTGCSILVKAKSLYKDDEKIGVVCIDKDLSEIDDLKNQVDKLQNRIHFLENQNLLDNLPLVVGNSPKMEELLIKAAKIARSDANVLINGESGVGKKALGHQLHKLSERQGVFVKVNCGAIPIDMFEEEFFGVHEEDEDRPGLFEMADGGTLYLGEVGDMPLKMQSKLLNILQKNEFKRVGGKLRQLINCRILSSTNRIISEMVEKGEFLEDLYYYLNVITLEIPPLRERGSDIGLLADHFLKELADKYQMDQPSISPRVKNILLEYEWRGNVRELKNILEHMTVMSGGKEITLDMVPFSVRESAGRFAKVNAQINDLAKNVGEYEKHIIQEVLDHTNWNKSQAARTLNIPRTTLMYKIDQYGIKENIRRKRKEK